MTELRLPKSPSRTVHFEIRHPYGPFDDQGIIVLWAEQLWERVPISEGSRQKEWKTTGWGWRLSYGGRIKEHAQAGQAATLMGCFQALENSITPRLYTPVKEVQRGIHLLHLCILEHIALFFNTEDLLDEEDDPTTVESLPALEDTNQRLNA
jgi:hypothetical protein